MATTDVDYSIIIPVYFNAGSLKPVFESIREHVIEPNQDRSCEVIFIDDGSGDTSLDELLELRRQGANREILKILKLSRNFGQVQATMAGYAHSNGKCVVTMSADLQDPPEQINAMLESHFSDGYEIVISTRESREDPLFARVTSRIFFLLMQKLSFPDMPAKGFDFFLLSRRVVDVILKNQESNPSLHGQIMWTGFDIKYLPYQRRKREIGRSRWTFGKKLKHLIDSVLAYSYFPVRLMSLIGFVVALLGFGWAASIFIAKFTGGVLPAQGWAPLMIMILVLSGIQMVMLGVIGEYLWRTLDQAKNRQPYIIERIYD